eukprot:3323217-Pyramimonas_sp.AAC.1
MALQKGPSIHLLARQLLRLRPTCKPDNIKAIGINMTIRGNRSQSVGPRERTEFRALRGLR